METLFLPVVAGPTASGKTSLAIDLARRCQGEIVSADSMQIYADLHIGTARPLPEEQGGIPHHLLGFAPLSQAFSVASYCRLAHAAIADIASRGRQPLLCGGTGLYIQAVTENLQFSEEPPDADNTLRIQLRQRAETEGGTALLAELAAVDPLTASRLSPNDHGRIIRALELYARTGRTMTEQNRLSHAVPSPYRTCLITLDARDRGVLYERIDRRVDAMLREGLIEEARQVLQSPFAPTALQAIGYKELAPYFDGRLSLAEAVDNLKRGTRRYAKRQLSWFRHMKGAHTLYIDDYADPAALGEAAFALMTAEKEG